MTRKVLSIALIFVSLVASAQSREDLLKEHLYYMASDSLRGRAAGSEDAAKAAAYIVDQYSAMGLKPFYDDWYQPFSDGQYKNVVAVIEGSDPALKDQYIVLGAHYDHIGVGKPDATGDNIYNGADDNASGSSALIEIARSLMEHRDKLGRSVIIAAFDAEELGLYGSTYLANQLKDEDVRLMVSIDMVGWYSTSGYLMLEGVSTLKGGRRFFSEEAKKCGINLKFMGLEMSILTATDTQQFAKNGVPAVAATTGLKSPYHKPGDEADLIDYKGLDLICGFFTDVALDASTQPDFEESGRKAVKHRPIGALAFGVDAGIGSSKLIVPDAGFTGSGNLSYAVGVSARFGFTPKSRFGLLTSVLLRQEKSNFPDEADLYNSRRTVSATSITVPAQLTFALLNFGDGVGYMVAGFGGYYGRVIQSNSPYVVNPNEGGLCYSVGLNLGWLGISYLGFSELGPFFSNGNAGRARMTSGLFRLTYWF